MQLQVASAVLRALLWLLKKREVAEEVKAQRFHVHWEFHMALLLPFQYQMVANTYFKHVLAHSIHAIGIFRLCNNNCHFVYKCTCSCS